MDQTLSDYFIILSKEVKTDRARFPKQLWLQVMSL